VLPLLDPAPPLAPTPLLLVPPLLPVLPPPSSVPASLLPPLDPEPPPLLLATPLEVPPLLPARLDPPLDPLPVPDASAPRSGPPVALGADDPHAASTTPNHIG
jgi:hypothetical protein